ncbi:MAG: putative metal-binding motif-containing protein [Polyangiaceae bacterium]|nr:putative metal-binding motif-containing protein [Polyangiaceae bacterium]
MPPANMSRFLQFVVGVLFALQFAGCVSPVDPADSEADDDESVAEAPGALLPGDSGGDEPDDEPVDADGDGYFAGDAKESDCNDNNASIHPGAYDVCGDGIDTNCDPKSCVPDGGQCQASGLTCGKLGL